MPDLVCFLREGLARRPEKSSATAARWGQNHTAYARIIEAPETVLKEIAACRYSPPEPLRSHFGGIQYRAQSGERFTLAQALRWLESPRTSF